MGFFEEMGEDVPTGEVALTLEVALAATVIKQRGRRQMLTKADSAEER